MHLYEVIWNAVLTGKEIGHGREGYYFGENGEHTLLDVAKAIGKALVDFRLAETEEPSPFTKEELENFFDGVSRHELFASKPHTLLMNTRSLRASEPTPVVVLNDRGQLVGKHARPRRTCWQG